jgi:hypothetical protein
MFMSDIVFSSFALDTGLWWASNHDILSIDPQTGVAIASSSGNTLVYYNASVSLPTYIEAKVVSVTDVEIVDASKTLISNCPGSSMNGSYVIHINFGEERTTPLPGCDGAILQDTLQSADLQFPFACLLSFENSHGFSTEKVFDIKAGYDNGKSACFISPKNLSSDDVKLLSTSQGNLLLSVKLQEPSKGVELSSSSVHLQFMPSFVVDRREVKLTGVEESIEIYGSDEMLQSLHVCIQCKYSILE